MSEKCYIDANGYYRFKDSDLLVHRYVMEKHLGRRLLDDEIIHHLDKNKQNNDIANLVVMSIEDHNKLHLNDILENGQRCIKCKVLIKTDPDRPLCYECWVREQYK